MAPILGYWNIRGLVDPIRFLLAHVGQEYEFKTYKFLQGAENVKGDWRSQQNSLGLEFPNIPYYIDSDLKITQLLAILRHLARKNGLTGNTEKELIRVDTFEQMIMEIMMTSFRTWITGDEALKAQLPVYLSDKLGQVHKALGGGRFILGDRLSHADFLLYSCLDYLRLYNAAFLDDFQALKNFPSKIEALPGVEKFIQSDKFSRFPITAPFAAWGSKEE